MKQSAILLSVFILLFTGATTSLADDSATPREVFDKLSMAAQAISDMGLESMKDPAVQKEFYKEFAWKDTYVVLDSCNENKVLAHPNPKYVGFPIDKVLCKRTGKAIATDFCANERPEGHWTEYWWTKPGEPEDKLFRKLMFTVPVPGQPGLLVGAGIYSETHSLEEMNQQVSIWAANN